MASDLGAVQKNLERATSFMEDAARQGAELVLLPELMPGGYTLTQRIWDTAEPFDGTTTRWLGAVCSRLGIYAGTTFLEAEGEDFFNTLRACRTQRKDMRSRAKEPGGVVRSLLLSRR